MPRLSSIWQPVSVAGFESRFQVRHGGMVCQHWEDVSSPLCCLRLRVVGSSGSNKLLDGGMIPIAFRASKLAGSDSIGIGSARDVPLRCICSTAHHISLRCGAKKKGCVCCRNSLTQINHDHDHIANFRVQWAEVTIIDNLNSLARISNTALCVCGTGP